MNRFFYRKTKQYCNYYKIVFIILPFIFIFYKPQIHLITSNTPIYCPTDKKNDCFHQYPGLGHTRPGILFSSR